jgi:hypothetical protein
LWLFTEKTSNMQAGFPFKKQITDRGTAFGYPGNGRYFYVLAMTNSPRAVLCLDSQLLTAANYLGSGVWSVNPIIADITVTGDPRALVFIPKLQEIWVVKQGSNAIDKIDANPDSATFNTILSSSSLTLSSGIHSAAIDVVNNVLFVGRGNQIFALVLDQQMNILLSQSTPSPSRCRSIKYDYNTRRTYISDETAGTHINDGARSNKSFSIMFLNAAHSGVAHTDTQYVYYQDNNVLRIANPVTLDLITSVSMSVRFCRMATSEAYNRVISGSYFSNNISFLERESLTFGGSVAKGAILSGEIGNISICVKDNIAVAIPVGALCQHVHVYNVENKTWIGYVNIGKTIGVESTGFQYVGAHTICKNEVDF